MTMADNRAARRGTARTPTTLLLQARPAVRRSTTRVTGPRHDDLRHQPGAPPRRGAGARGLPGPRGGLALWGPAGRAARCGALGGVVRPLEPTGDRDPRRGPAELAAQHLLAARGEPRRRRRRPVAGAVSA